MAIDCFRHGQKVSKRNPHANNSCSPINNPLSSLLRINNSAKKKQTKQYAEDRDKRDKQAAERQIVGRKFDERDEEGNGTIEREQASLPLFLTLIIRVVLEKENGGRSKVSESQVMSFTIYDRGPIFHARYLHTWNHSVGANKVGVGKVSPRAFRRRIARYRHPLGCRAIELEKTPQGGMIFTVVFGTVWARQQNTPGLILKPYCHTNLEQP